MALEPQSGALSDLRHASRASHLCFAVHQIVQGREARIRQREREREK